MNLIDFLFHAPKSDWIKFIFFFLGILFLMVFLELIRKKADWSQEVSRKFIHISVGILVMFTPYYFESNRPIIWLSLIFLVVDLMAIRTGLLKGMHGTARVSYGTAFFPLSIFILLVFCWSGSKAVFMSSVLIMTIPDAFAAIVGENIKRPHRYRLGKDEKSIEGSLVMFFTTLICIALALPVFIRLDSYEITGPVLWIAGITACMATALEAISSKGSDNLTVPLGSALFLYIMSKNSTGENLQLVTGLFMALVIAVLSCRVRFLSPSGSMGTFILATIIFGLGGWSWTVPILTFFILSSLLSKTGRKRKQKLETVFEKSGRRDIGQVMANGGLPGVLVILNIFFPHPFWYYGYLSALAAVNADTWATEIGVLSKTGPRLITTGKPVAHGISGGITPLGLLGAFLGSLIIVLTGLLFYPENAKLMITQPLFYLILFSGFFATIMDSLLGATLQGQYQCSICRTKTEKRIHCDQSTSHISGWFWMNNDMVNLVCAVSGVFFVFFGWMSGISH